MTVGITDGWAARLQDAHDARNPSLLLEAVPYAAFLGFELQLIDGQLRAKMPFQEHLVGDSGLPALHGGTLGALLESTAIFSVMWAGEGEILARTINLTVEYLRTGHPRDTYAAAEIVKLGRRVANVRTIAWQDDRERPITAAHCHLILKR